MGEDPTSDAVAGPLSRRRLMTTGGVMAAGAAVVVVGPGATPASAEVASNVTFTPYGAIGSNNVQLALQELETEKQRVAWADVRTVGADGGGVLDDTDELNAAIDLVAAAGGGTVLLSRGHYKISGVVTVHDGVDLWGIGGIRQVGEQYDGAVIEASDDDSQLVFEGRGGQSGNFVLDGNWEAEPTKGLMYVNACKERLFSSMLVVKSAGKGVVLDKTQNCTFIAFQVEHCTGDSLTLDVGAGGNAFIRNEFNATGGNNVVIKESAFGTGPYDEPIHNFFLHCIIERGPFPDGANTRQLLVSAGNNNTFDHCMFATELDNTSSLGVVAELTGGEALFQNCTFTGSEDSLGGSGGIGLKVSNAGAFFAGRNEFRTPIGVHWGTGAYGTVLGLIKYGDETVHWSGSHANIGMETRRPPLVLLDDGAGYGLRVARGDEEGTGMRFQVTNGASPEIQLSDGTTFNAKATWRLQSSSFGWETPDSVHIAGGSNLSLAGGNITINEAASNPAAPTADNQARMYVKTDKLVVQWKEGTTVRYRYMRLNGTSTAWTHTTNPADLDVLP